MSRVVWNLHNHTPFSDGALSIDELVDEHLKIKGIEIGGVGICDALFCTPTSRPVASERQYQQMFQREAREYVDMVQQARRRWQGKARLLCGAEVHWGLNKAMLAPLREILAELEIEYVLFACLDWAALTQLANQARRFPCPVGLARTDVAAAFPNTSMDQVVRTMANARIFWEFTADMHARHTCDAWCAVLSQHKVRIGIATDTHDDVNCLKALPGMYDFLNHHQLIDRVLIPEPRAPIVAGTAAERAHAEVGAADQ